MVRECYVAPAYRNRAVGSALLDAAIALAPLKGWVCMELRTPPLPEFAKSLAFYQKHARSSRWAGARCACAVPLACKALGVGSFS